MNSRPGLCVSFAVVALFLGTADLALGDDIRTERVQFAAGSTGTKLEGRITGYETVDYKLGAKAGQRMIVTMTTDNGANYFNLLAPGETEVAFFNGSMNENSFAGTLPESGDYTIRVYQMRSAARRNETATYRLDVEITSTDRAGDRSGGSTDALVPGTPPETEQAVSAAEGTAPEAALGESESPLAGTSWQLVEFQSMDDSVGTVSPEGPSLYTMSLNGDGTVDLRLNCNRANGTWSAEPSEDGQSGRFEFGPLSMTRALCPPPSLDEQIATQSEYIRSYLLRDGNLYLSLMADGGIYAWEPRSEETEVPFETEPNAELEAAILQVSPDYTREIVEIGGQRARYLYGGVDLNGDGKEEVFVYLLGSIFCGTGGCNLLLFSDTENGYSLVNEFPISRLPVIVSPQRTRGWNDLARPESGGGAPPSYVVHTFDGSKYVEHERLPPDTAPAGTNCLVGDFTFDDGIPLEPPSR
jgi:heat shock protein HslJ